VIGECDPDPAIWTPQPPPPPRPSPPGYLEDGFRMRHNHNGHQVKASAGRGMSTAVSPPMSTPTRRSPFLLTVTVVMAALWGSGCCVVDGSCLAAGVVDNEAVRGGPEGDVAGGATPGCLVEAITTTDGERCASCDFAATICGLPVEAACESRQNSVGAACQLCITADGTVLYDDCFISADVGLEAVACESTPGADADSVCSTCFDSFGNAVSSSCAPRADSCTDFIAADGRRCANCVRDDNVVFTTCDAADIDPSRCEAYGNDAGRCVDCFDDAGAQLSHACTPTDGVVRCEERVQPEGLVCTVCFDSAGLITEQRCDNGTPQFERCERLEFSEQSCSVCVDAKDTVVFVDCIANSCEGAAVNAGCRSDADCATGQACFDGVCVARSGDPSAPEASPPDASCEAPACAMTINNDGAVCRTCPTSLGTSETRCLSAQPLTCENLPEGDLPPLPDESVGENFSDGAVDRPAVPPQGRTCTLCRDRTLGIEVYRDCEGNGAVPPPICLDVDTADGGSCSACFDAVTNAPVYTSCPGESCYDLSVSTLTSLAGTALTVDNANAAAACRQCDGDAGQTVSCQLEQRCSGDLFADASGACAGTAVVTIQPLRCENSWESWRPSRARDDDLRGLMAFALDSRQLTIQAATSRPGGNIACAVDDCTCARGDLIDLVVTDTDRAAVESVFADLLAP